MEAPAFPHLEEEGLLCGEVDEEGKRTEVASANGKAFAGRFARQGLWRFARITGARRQARA